MATATTTQEIEMTTTFQTGSTYTARSSCNWDCIFSFRIVSRTAKFITVNDGHSTKRVGVSVGDDGVEQALPQGNYSMAPYIYANEASA
jgi:hypothetical protein